MHPFLDDLPTVPCRGSLARLDAHSRLANHSRRFAKEHFVSQYEESRSGQGVLRSGLDLRTDAARLLHREGRRGGVLHLFLPLFQRSRLVELSLFFTHLRAGQLLSDVSQEDLELRGVQIRQVARSCEASARASCEGVGQCPAQDPFGGSNQLPFLMS